MCDPVAVLAKTPWEGGGRAPSGGSNDKSSVEKLGAGQKVRGRGPLPRPRPRTATDAINTKILGQHFQVRTRFWRRDGEAVLTANSTLKANV